MELSFQTIFRGLNPYTVASDLGLEIRHGGPANQACYVRHPSLNEDVVITTTGFASKSTAGQFIAGDSFDFLASILGGYRQAVHHVLTRYSHVADNTFGVNLMAFADYFETSLQLRREGFMRLVALRDNLTETPNLYSDAAQWLQGRQIETEAATAMVYAARGEELARVLNHPAFDEPQLKFNPFEQYLVMPFFRDYHECGVIQIQSVYRDDDQQFLNLNGGHGFFGLHNCPPDQPDVQVFRNVNTCLEAQGFLFRRAMTAGAVAIPFGFVHGQRPKRPGGIFVLDDQVPDLGRMVFCRQAFDRFMVSHHGLIGLNLDGIAAMGWHDYLRHQLSESIHAERGCGRRTLALLDAMKSDHAGCDHILKWLSTQNQPGILTKVRERIGAHRQYRFDRIEVSEHNFGYSSRKVGGDNDTPFTNFTVQFERNLWFNETEEWFHQGQVTISGRAFPVSIDQATARNANHLEDAMITAVLKHGGADCGIPKITDPSMKRRLVQLVSHQVGCAPTLNGIKRIGWDAKKRQFVTPCWQATALGLTTTSRVGYPGSEALSYFNFHPVALTTSTELVPSPAKAWLSLLAAIVARVIAGQVTPAIAIRRTPEARHLLHALFLGLGQSSAIPITTSDKNRPIHPFELELATHPAFGQAQGEVNIDGCQLPMFVLAASGLPYDGPMNEAIYSQCYTLSYQVLSQLTVGILRDREKPAFSPSLTTSALIYEGRQLIAKYCGLNFEALTTGLSLMESLLASIPAADVPNHFHRDPASDTVFIDFTQRPQHDRVAIHAELKACIPEAFLYRQVWIGVPALPLLELLNRFYGGDVKVFLRAAESDTPTVQRAKQPAQPKTTEARNDSAA